MNEIRNVLNQLMEENNKESKKERLEDFLEEVYGDGVRKGLNKLNISHPFDVVDNIGIENIDDLDRSIRLMREGFLHDILEDYDIDRDELKERIKVREEELDILEKLTRGDKGNKEYWEEIFKDDDALRVKLADRISNLEDLKNWVRTRKGFTEESKKIYDKYKKESKIIDEIFKEKYDRNEYTENGEVSYIWKMKVREENLLDELERRVNKYGETIRERRINEKLFDVEAYDIDKEDIFDTIDIVREMYDKYPELQDSYPDFEERLDNAIDSIEEIWEEKGFDYLKGLFDKVEFDVDDYFDVYNEYIRRKIIDIIPKLSSLKEETPKSEIKEKLADRLGLSIKDLERKIVSKDKGDIEEIYQELTDMMDEEFEDVSQEVLDYAKNNQGDAIWRPTKYKELESAIDKFIKNVDKGKYQDFLDLTDILGFRGRFDEVQDMMEFSIDIIEDHEQFLFKINNHLGKGEAYQGVNMNFNYDGKFNYEVQAVVDKIQVATDLNHDILYKEMMEVTDRESDAVRMLVQICMALVFEDLFEFDSEDLK